MNIPERLKLAIKVGAILTVSIGLIAVQPGPPETDYQQEQIEVIPIALTTSTSLTTTSTTLTTTATTVKTTTSTTSTTTVVTTAEPIETETETIVEIETEPETEAPMPEPIETAEETPGDLIRGGMRGTYYAPGSWNNCSATGGSGRALLDCNYGGDGYAKGSIASGYLYNLLGYYQNGGRTTVWLEVSGYSDMNGLYYLDDCSGADVIDFFYNANGNCQFNYDGVVSVDVYYAN